VANASLRRHETRFLESNKRRFDPYQERARIGIAAGFDPDARIERAGLRSMPTWCTFRDAAPAEHRRARP
jgi:hypothetical protein